MSAPLATRRTLLIGAAGLTAVAVSQTTPAGWRVVDTSVEHPDAALLAACATFAIACANMAAISAADAPTDAELEVVVDAWRAPIDTITDTPATTPEGVRAKAQAVIGYFANTGVSKYNWETLEEAMSGHEMMAWRLAHEIVAMGSAVS